MDVNDSNELKKQISGEDIQGFQKSKGTPRTPKREIMKLYKNFCKKRKLKKMCDVPNKKKI